MCILLLWPSDSLNQHHIAAPAQLNHKICREINSPVLLKFLFIFLYKLFWIVPRVQRQTQGYIQQNDSSWGGRGFVQFFFPALACVTVLLSFSECHPSCWLCTGPSADNCTSCTPPSSLHEGRCLPGCPQGSFAQDDQCQGERPRPYSRWGAQYALLIYKCNKNLHVT